MDFAGYTRDVTLPAGMDMSGSMAPRFFMDKVVDPEATKKEGYEVFKDAPHIELYFDNGMTKLTCRVFEDGEIPHPEQDWKRRFPQHWALFLEGKNDAVIGTPIEELFPSSPSKAEYYKTHGVKTVEQLAHTSDTNVTGLGMGATQDREAAKKHITAKKDGAVYKALAREKEALELKIKESEEKAAAQAVKMEALSEQVAALTKLLTDKNGKRN